MRMARKLEEMTQGWQKEEKPQCDGPITYDEACIYEGRTNFDEMASTTMRSQFIIRKY